MKMKKFIKINTSYNNYEVLNNSLNNLKEILKEKMLIKQTSFQKDVALYLYIDDELVDDFLNYLNNLKINLKVELFEQDEEVPVGTDKPIGSKEAIDEN